MNLSKKFLFAISFFWLLSGCVDARKHSASVHSTADQEITAGIVQREITVGMSKGDVAKALGSPNIVDRDRGGLETWIYDKIASEASYSRSSGATLGGVGAGGTPGASLLLGLGLGGYSADAGAQASTQKTLTVIIKFGDDGKVSNFSYHTTKF
jgi:outer membrane protein assembly factor BamE (lipoprotein component of BamABCDE complex)